MNHPKHRVFDETTPAGAFVICNGNLVGDEVSSGERVLELFRRGSFRYQFLKHNWQPERRSRICKCDNSSESEWLARQVDAGSAIVVKMME